MILRKIDFGCVANASGARGFFDEGYWFHKIFRPFGLNFDEATFVAKTITLKPRKGNMALNEDGITPKEWSPNCIIVKPSAGVVLNALGLSNPGAEFLLEQRRWQNRERPFLLSFMAVEDNVEKRLKETKRFVKLFKRNLSGFRVIPGLEINFSCPNVGLKPEKLIKEERQALDIAADLDIPLAPKINATILPEVAAEIANHPACDAIVCSNTIPWGKLPEWIDWMGIFGTGTSPLAHLGGGGLSGSPLLPVLVFWLKSAQRISFPKPIIACGGILSKIDIEKIHNAGASAIQLGSVAILRPWRVASLIKHANEIFAGKNVV